MALTDPNLISADQALYSAQSTLDSINAANTNLTGEVTTLNGEVSSLNTQVSSLQSQVASLQSQLAAASNSKNAPIVPVFMGGLQTGALWTQNGNVGNTGGGNTTIPHGTYKEVLDTTGAMMTFTVNPAYPYDNYYFSKHFAGFAPGKYRFVYHQQFQFRTTGDSAKCQAYEFEMQWSDAAHTFNMAWQCNMSSSKTWRYFHYTGTAGTGGWVDTKIPVDLTSLASGAIMDVYATFICDSAAATATHESLIINGVVNPINVTQAAVAKGESAYFRVANQLDTKGSVLPAVPPPYSLSFAADVMRYPLN